MDYRKEAPEILKGFLTYHESIKSHSGNTVDEYYLDLRAFFRFLKRLKGFVPDKVPLDEISITDVDLDFVRNVTLKEVYDYLDYLSKDRARNPNSPYSKKGLSAAARARKVATVRSFYKYLTTKAKLLEINPVADLCR